MKLARCFSRQANAWAVCWAASFLLAPALAAAEAPTSTIRFQKPSRGTESAPANPALQFRSSSGGARAAAPQAAEGAAASQVTTKVAKVAVAARPLSAAPKVAAAPIVRQAATRHKTVRPSFAQPSREVVPANHEPWYGEDGGPGGIMDIQSETILGAPCESCVDCAEPACGCAEPGCGICEPECGLVDPGCGLMEPGCGLVDPGCGIMEPTCGCGDPDCGAPDCGSCVGNPGPDYWCFPVCLPRLKEFTVWGGVHGFKGPRDVFDGGTDGNFGFQEGFNLGGRAPLVGLLFPQLSYQLGYQAVQSRLSGSSNSTEDRSQQFVTAGLFRRVPTGLQFGAVWDGMRDDFVTEEDFHQIRYEISIKSQQGREIGFMGATHTNNAVVGAHDYQSVDQYVGFFRCHFREASEVRFWGGATNDSEGLFGADFYAPLNNRWSLQSGFNYLITDHANGAVAAREESWNVGMNLVWHFGKTAKKSLYNPHRPLFSVADNGWMFIDERP